MRERMPAILTVALAIVLFAVLYGMSGCEETAYVTQHEQRDLLVYVVVRGNSMQPTFPDSAIVPMVLGFPYDELVVGDTVLFWDYKRGGYTHHRLVGKQGPYFIARGDNKETNPVADKPFVTKDNYIGKTFPNWTKVLVAP